MRIVFAIFAVAVTITCSANSGTTELVCSLIRKADDGYRIVLSDMHVLQSTASNEEFHLPSGAPKDVVSVICYRSSIVPSPGDVKVLEAGFSLILVSKASGTIELSKAKETYQFRQVNGEMSATDRKAVEAWAHAINEHRSSGSN